MIDNKGDLLETMDMLKILIDHIDEYYSVNNTFIKDVRPDSTKFVLERAAAQLYVMSIKKDVMTGD